MRIPIAVEDVQADAAVGVDMFVDRNWAHEAHGRWLSWVVRVEPYSEAVYLPCVDRAGCPDHLDDPVREARRIFYLQAELWAIELHQAQVPQHPFAALSGQLHHVQFRALCAPTLVVWCEPTDLFVVGEHFIHLIL